MGVAVNLAASDGWAPPRARTSMTCSKLLARSQTVALVVRALLPGMLVQSGCQEAPSSLLTRYW